MTIELLTPTPSDLARLLAGDEHLDTYEIVDGALPPAFILRAALDAAQDEEALRWAVPHLFVTAGDGLIVGSGGFKGPPSDGAVEIGYGVAPSSRGFGFATQAVRQLLLRAFAVPVVKRVCAETAIDNLPSRRVVEKAGFSHAGRRETVDDGTVDCWTCVRREPGSPRQNRSPRIDLRDADGLDAGALAALNVASWQAAYAHMLPEALLASLDVAAWEARLRARLEDAAQFTIVARAGRRRLGFVTAGPIRDEPPARGGEVYALYVDPRHSGHGVGSALLEAAETRLAGSGFSRASLWVFTRNTEARRFYERRGWCLEPHHWYWQKDGLRRQLVCYSRPLVPE